MTAKITTNKNVGRKYVLRPSEPRSDDVLGGGGAVITRELELAGYEAISATAANIIIIIIIIIITIIIIIIIINKGNYIN
jgi:hypothetical protein